MFFFNILYMSINILFKGSRFMKKRNLQLLAFVLFLVLAQNSLANKFQQGNGSETASDETVAVGQSWTDSHGVEHKNIAGDTANQLKNIMQQQ